METNFHTWCCVFNDNLVRNTAVDQFAFPNTAVKFAR
jgi:hypothetical protein